MNIGDYLLSKNKITQKQREKAELEHEIQSTSRTKKHDFVLLDNFRDVKIPKGTHQQLIFWQLWLGPFKLPCNDKD